jgi:hypothetical protein
MTTEELLIQLNQKVDLLTYVFIFMYLANWGKSIVNKAFGGKKNG